MSRLIKLFGGPGIGKSSIAAGITYKLKKRHISANNPYEFPKKLAWDNNMEAISDQLYVFANQHRGIVSCYGKVDYIVIDSPILFSLIYHTLYTLDFPANLYGESFRNLIVDLHKKYYSLNILLERGETVHNDNERLQDYEQSLKIDKQCKKILEEHNIEYHTVKVGENTVDEIINLLEL